MARLNLTFRIARNKRQVDIIRFSPRLRRGENREDDIRFDRKSDFAEYFYLMCVLISNGVV